MLNFSLIQNLVDKAYAYTPPGIVGKPEEGVIYNPAITTGDYGRGGTEKGTTIIGSLLSNGFTAMLIVGAIILVIMIIWSGISMMTSGADKERVQTAQKRLTYAIVGFIILICVFAIAGFVGSFFGLDFFKTLKFPFPTS
jgi:cytochrome bd-type quinol oxidase subunit 2